MSTYTNNLNLIKPGYDDDIDVAQLNNNSDVIDTQITNIINVNDAQNTNISKLDGRVTTLENKTYPYLPLTGGNLTGDLTVNNIEVPFTRTKTEFTRGIIIADKYVNGKLVITIIDLIKSGVTLTGVTFPIPFVGNLQDLICNVGNISSEGVSGLDVNVPYNVTTTNFSYRRGNVYSKTTYQFIGRWK